MTKTQKMARIICNSHRYELDFEGNLKLTDYNTGARVTINLLDLLFDGKIEEDDIEEEE